MYNAYEGCANALTSPPKVGFSGLDVDLQRLWSSLWCGQTEITVDLYICFMCISDSSASNFNSLSSSFS